MTTPIAIRYLANGQLDGLASIMLDHDGSPDQSLDAASTAALQAQYRAYLTALNRDAPTRRFFDLERIFPDSPNLDQQLAQIDDLNRCLNSFRPLTPEQTASLEQYLEHDFTYESTHIEGNTLTRRETTLILEKGLTVAGKSLHEHLEVINHAHAIQSIKAIAAQQLEFTPLQLRSIHQLVLSAIEPQHAGVYRTIDVSITGSSHIPPPYYLIAEQMDAYFAFYEAHKTTRHSVLLAADLLEKLVSIHPFVDGNGRTARLVMNLVLLQRGYPIANIPGDPASRLAYYAALEEANRLAQSDRLYRLIAREVKRTAFWILNLISTSQDPSKGGYFFARLAPYLPQ